MLKLPLYDTAHSVSLSNTEITSAIQGVIWNLDGQISGTMTSSDAGTAGFANFLYSQANSIGTYNVGGYVRFSADGNYADPLHPTGTNGQSQIGVAPVPEPSAFLVLGFPLLGLAFRRQNR